MSKIIDIENFYSVIYNQKFLRYRLYSCINYRLNFKNGVYLILSEKENYKNGKSNFSLQLFIEQGNCIFQKSNLDIDKKKLQYMDIDDYIKQLFNGKEEEYGQYIRSIKICEC